jgi:solute carrier family 35 protein F5
VTYLGASLLVVYLPVAFLKDWTRNLLKRQSSKSGNDATNVNGSSDELSSPLSRKIFEMELQGTLTKKDSELDLASSEEGKPLVSRHKDDLNVLIHDKEPTIREIAMCGFYIAPIWFVTEVKYQQGCKMNVQNQDKNISILLVRIYLLGFLFCFA